MKKPKILAITSELPWPLNTGGHIRTYHILKSIAQNFDLTLVVPELPSDAPGVQQLQSVGVRVLNVKVGPRSAPAEAKRALVAALKSEPYVMYHRHNRAEVRRAIQMALQKTNYDAVYLDHLDPYAFHDLFPGQNIIVDLHNVYSLLAERVAEEHHGIRRWYLHREARLLAKIEKEVATQASGLMTVSQEEQKDFTALGNSNVHLVANGVDCSSYFSLPLGRSHSAPVLLYIGALSWQPNAQAAKYLAHEVIGKVRQGHPQAVLKLVGRDPDKSVLELGEIPGVEVHANVPDIGVYLAEASMLVVALDSGGGTRLKILEAFAAGLPVISTATGCEGIACEHGKHLWIAERKDFSAAIDYLVTHPELATSLATHGRALVENQYDWSALGRYACKAIESVLEQSAE